MNFSAYPKGRTHPPPLFCLLKCWLGVKVDSRFPCVPSMDVQRSGGAVAVAFPGAMDFGGKGDASVW